MASSAPNGDQANADSAQVKEHLRAAGDAAASAARARARQAQGWAQDQWSGFQDTIEEQPYRATAWALGIGLVAGILLTSFIRTRR